MDDAHKSSSENPSKTRLSSFSSFSSNSEDEIDGRERKVKQKKKKRGIAEKFQELKTKPKKKQEKNKESDAMGSLSDGETLQKPPKRHIGVIARIKRFGSKDELDNFPNDDKSPIKLKEKKKSFDNDSDTGKRHHKLESKPSLLDKLRRFSEDSSSDDDEFAKEALSLANRYRKNHGLRRLRANKELNDLAYDWARKLGREQLVNERYTHKYGKNVYSKELSNSDEKLKPEDVINEWYQEINDFTFGQNTRDTDIARNATQLLWKSSKEVGIAKCRANERNIIFVAAYFHPRGNIDDQYKDQVPPVGGFDSKKSGDHSSSSESSSDDEAKQKEKQEEKIHGKQNKKKFLSHMFDKFRKNSDGDSEHKKKEKKEKEHHGFIGHRSGKYFINIGKDQDPKEKEKDKEKEKEKDKENSNFYIVTTKEVEDIKRNLRTQNENHDSTVFDSKDLDLNKNEAKTIVLAERECSKVSSSSSDEDVAAYRDTHLEIEKKDASLLKEDDPLFTKLSQDISKSESNFANGSVKQQLKSEERKNTSTEKVVHDQRRRSSTSSDSDNDNCIKEPPSPNQKSITTNMLSEIKDQIKSIQTRKSISSEDEQLLPKEIKYHKEESDVEAKVSSDISQKTGFFSQMKIKMLQSVDKSSSDDDEESRSITKHQATEKDKESDPLFESTKRSSLTKDSSSDEESKDPKICSHHPSQLLTEEPKVEPKETKENKLDHSSSDEELKVHKSNDIPLKDESSTAGKTDIFSKFKKQFGKKRNSSSDEERITTSGSTTLIYAETNYEIDDSLSNKQEKNHLIYNLQESQSKRRDSSSSNDEKEHKHKQNDEGTVHDQNSKEFGIFDKLKNQFKKKRTHSVSTDEESKDSNSSKTEISKNLTANVEPKVSLNYQGDQPKLETEGKSEDSSGDEGKHLEQRQSYESPKDNEIIHPNNIPPIPVIPNTLKTRHSSSGSSSDEGNNELNSKKLENTMIHSDNVAPELTLRKSEEIPENLEDNPKTILHDSSCSSDDNKNGLFRKLKDKLVKKNDEHNSSSSDEAEEEVKTYTNVIKEIQLPSDLKSSADDNLLQHKNVTAESNDKDSKERSSSSEDEKKDIFGKQKQTNYQYINNERTSFEYKERDIYTSSIEGIQLHHKEYENTTSNSQSHIDETFPKSSMFEKLKDQFRSKRNDESSSSDEEEEQQRHANADDTYNKNKIIAPEYEIEEATLNTEFGRDSATKRTSSSSSDDEESSAHHKELFENSCAPSDERKEIGLIHVIKDHFNKTENDESKGSSSDEEQSNANKKLNDKELNVFELKSPDKMQRTGSFSSDDDKDLTKESPILKAEDAKHTSEHSNPTDAPQKRNLYGKIRSFLTRNSDEGSSSDDEKNEISNQNSSIAITYDNTVTTEVEAQHKQDNPSNNKTNLKTSPKLGLFKKLKGKLIKSNDDSDSSSDEDHHENSDANIIKEVHIDSDIRSTKTDNLLHHTDTSDSDINDKELNQSDKTELVARRKDVHSNNFSSSSSDEHLVELKPPTKKNERDSYVEKLKHVFENLNSKPFSKHDTSNKLEMEIIDHEKYDQHIEQMLKSINRYRSYHQAEKLVINKQMCNLALERANSFACGIAGNLHSNIGENIFIYPSSGRTLKDASDLAVKTWYKTIMFHQFGVEPDEYDTKSGSFTQLVWKSSKEIGIGIHESDRENRIFIVAIFSPAGNVKGQFTNDVQPRISIRSDSSSSEGGKSDNDRLI